MPFGLILFIILMALVVVCVIVIALRSMQQTKQATNAYGNASDFERGILECKKFNYSDAINSSEFIAFIGRYPMYTEMNVTVNPGNAIITKGFVKMDAGALVPKTYIRNAAFSFNAVQIVNDSVSYTQASATKRAAAGAVIGGAAGAVVGAVSAAETNKNGGVAHHTLTDTQNYMVSFTGPGSKVPHIDGILLNNELKAKLEANPEVMACIKEQNGNYIRMPGIITALGTAKEAAVLAAWLNENILNKA